MTSGDTVLDVAWLTGDMLRGCERLSDDVLDRPIELSVAGVDGDPTLRSLLARLVDLSVWLRRNSVTLYLPGRASG